MLEARRLQALQRVSDLAALESKLAAIPPHSALFVAATHLRVQWRRNSGDRALAAQALELLDGLPILDRRPGSHLIQRAELAGLAGDSHALKACFNEMLRFLEAKPDPRVAAEALRSLRATPPELREAIGYASLEARFASVPSS